MTFTTPATAPSAFHHHPLVATSKTPLGQLIDQWNAASPSHRLVRNENGLIDGIVDLHDVRRLLSAENQVERMRWEKVAVGTIAETVFAVPHELRHALASPSPAAPSPPAASSDAASSEVVSSEVASSELASSEVASAPVGPVVPIYDAAGCVALVADGETYVSWSRVATAMRQHQFDPVTRLPTRMAFNQRIREELNRAARSRQAIALLMIDLDYFKQINDRLGHRAGDSTLRMVADSLCAGVRSYDFVARFGGDEFAVLCYDCHPQTIGLPIRRLQQAVAALPAPEGAARVSLSIGAALLEKVSEGCPAEVIIEQADACLYQAKRSGRSTAFAVQLDAVGNPVSPKIEVGAKAAGHAISLPAIS